MSRKVVGPFSRVEGHLEIDLHKNDTHVLEARVNSPMYRGMETVLLGRDPLDALTIVPRICGICSVSQSAAAARALAKLSEVHAPLNGQYVANLVLACEMLANHLSHFYLFFMPDFARDIYSDKIWYNRALDFKAQQGQAQISALEARNRLLHLMGELAGKWPHTLALRPGGTTTRVKPTQKLKLKNILNQVRRFLEQSLFGDSLDNVLSLHSLQDYEIWRHTDKGDLRFFLKISDDLGLEEMGRTQSVLLSGGGFDTDLTPVFRQGIYANAMVAPLPVDDIAEDITHSFMDGPSRQHPSNAQNNPLLDKKDAYSWCKAPRLDGARCEVGALARQIVTGNPLLRHLYEDQASNVENRIFARTQEMAQLVTLMEGWVEAIDPADDFYTQPAPPQDGSAFAFVEAARGTLGHWIEVTNGKVSNYQIIAPTTWNFSPRDENNQAGPLEDALENAPILAGEDDPVSVQHIVRSFDPCMACTVH